MLELRTAPGSGRLRSLICLICSLRVCDDLPSRGRVTHVGGATSAAGASQEAEAAEQKREA